MDKTKFIIPVFFISVFIITTGALILLPTENQSDFGSAKTFEAITTEGDVFSLDKIIGKKMIIIDFMATWCQPCRDIGSIYSNILDDYGENISIVSITTYHLDSSNILANWSFAWGFDWTFIPYSNKTDDIMDLYGGIDEGIPMSFFIDLEGIIRVEHLGARLSYSTVEKWINGNYI